MSRLNYNIEQLIKSVITLDNLRPHVKTHKSEAVTRLLIEAGLYKFKCATIAEAEMLAKASARDVLLAYTPVGPKRLRFLELMKQYPATKFSCLLDSKEGAAVLSAIAQAHHQSAEVYIDLNVGMNRTGILPEQALSLAEEIERLPGLSLKGLHAYDGHVDESDPWQRKAIGDEIYRRVKVLQARLEVKGMVGLKLVMGGSPTFPVYASYTDVECSPGTFVFWDDNYLTAFPDQDFLPAALIMGRVISLPAPDLLSIDIGHKAVASERSIDRRIRFLNGAELKPVSHSEEHLVVRVPIDHGYKTGDIMYGLPAHICPTVALYQEAVVIENHQAVAVWEVTARNRKLSV
ncbi:D-threonine aldolase [compost metagenome]